MTYTFLPSEAVPTNAAADPAKLQTLLTEIAAKTDEVDVRATSTVDLIQQAAVDDGITDFATPWTNAKTAAGSGGVVRVRWEDTGIYYSSSGLDLSGVVIDADEKTAFQGPISLYSDIEVRRPFEVRYRDGSLSYNYRVVPRPSLQDPVPIRAAVPRSEHVYRETLASALMSAEKLSWDTGDTWSADAIGSASTANYSWASLTNDGYLHANMIPVMGDNGPKDISWAWFYVLSTNASIGVAVRCSQGWCAVLCLGDDATMTIYKRPYGGSTTSSTLAQWIGRDTHENWLPRQARWSVRAVNAFSFSVVLNGVEIKRIDVSSLGHITDIGPAVYKGSAGTVTIQAAELMVEERQTPSALPAVGMLYVGDSKTDVTSYGSSTARFPNGYAHFVDAMLDFEGARLAYSYNIAVAGETVAQQKTRLATFMATSDIDNVTDAVISLGTNDIQGSTAYTSVYSDLADMIQDLLDLGIRVTVFVPDEYYSRALAQYYSGITNYGQNTSGYQTGSGIRSTIARVATDKGVGLVDGTRATGLEIAHWLDLTYATFPGLCDDIHYNPMGAARIAGPIFREVFRQIAPHYTPNQLGLSIPPNWMGAGFTGTNLQVSVVGNSKITFHGTITSGSGGAAFSGGNIFVLPRHLRPANDRDFWIHDGGGTVGVGRIFAATGIVTSYISTSSPSITVNADYIARH